MRDTAYNAGTAIAVVALAAFTIFVLVSLGRMNHPAEDCREDEAWAPVHHQTQGADTDTHGVTRMCVNMEEL